MSWDGYLDQYLTDTNAAACAGLANRSDGAFYAAAPSAGEKGWGLIYAEPQNRQIMQEDGTFKDVWIDEAATLLENVKRDIKKEGPTKEGLWLGGKKWRVLQKEDTEASDQKLTWMLAMGPNETGIHIVCTAQSIVCAWFDGPTSKHPTGNCKNAAIEFAVYMASQGL